MNLRRPGLRLNFQVKVLIPVITIMIALVATTSWLVNRRITDQLDAESARALVNANTAFQNAQKIRVRNLVLRYQNVLNEPRLKAASTLGDAKTMRYQLGELVAELSADAVVFSTVKGEPLAGNRRDPFLDLPQFQTTSKPAVLQALLGQVAIDTITVGQHLYNVVALPVLVSGSVVGVLTFGTELDDAAAREFQQSTHCEIALLASSGVAAATLDKAELTRQGSQLFSKIPREPSTAAVENVGDVHRVELLGLHYLVLAGRLNTIDNSTPLGYLLLASNEQAISALRGTQRLLLIVGLLGVWLSTGSVWMIIRTVTRPLRALRDGAVAVGEGDFTRRVTVRGNDECAQLGAAFNQMTTNLETSRSDLENTVQTLKSTQAQLSQSEKLSAIGEFVAGVTHELNNPLTAVIGFAQLLQRYDVTEKQKGYLDRVVSEAQRCHRIVQSLLSFARRHAPERKAIDLNASVEAAIDILQYQLRTTNIEVKTELHPELPKVMADQHQIQQVFVNIINNARQAIESFRHGGGTISVTTGTVPSGVRVLIRDNGPGIPDDNLKKLFNPFFTTKEVGKGTGLGLSLCYGIINEHGGTIGVHSRLGEGASFIIELPRATAVIPDAALPTAPTTTTASAATGQGKRVLVVDDEEAIRELICEVLKDDNYEVDTAGDGQAALELWQQRRYDLTVCDLKMPGVSGQQFYERLTTQDPSTITRWIFMTGDVIGDHSQDFIKDRGIACLAKPLSMPDLRAAVNQVINN